LGKIAEYYRGDTMKKCVLSIVHTCLSIVILGIGNLAPAFAGNPQQLTVGLYPYVPRIEQFKTAIQSEWQKVQPNVTLNFLSDSQWDGGYDINPPAEADVYVFDAMFFEYFRFKNWLEPLNATEIQNLSDFVPYALDGVKVDSQYYAIPQLGCAEILFYHKGDNEIAKASTLNQLKTALSQCSYTSQIPPDRRGLMVDMSGGSTDAALYLDATHSLTGQYPFPLPMNEAEINQTSIKNLRLMLSIGSFENATKSDQNQPYQFATWFSNGWSRAYIGYTESMSAMTDSARNDVAFKVVPFSDNTSSPSVFYADVIAVNTTTNQRGTRALAVQLANVMAAASTMIQSIGPSNNTSPQYLMPTRPSVFSTLGQNYPLYNQMYGLITSNNPIMFKANQQSREWLKAMKNTIKRDMLSNTICGCDFPATQPIIDNSSAAPICNATCGAHGGWNGQWTNKYPAAQNGSVCGCASCPVP
jgi:thiamine pyridinylase